MWNKQVARLGPTKNEVGDVQPAQTGFFGSGKLWPEVVFDDTDGGCKGCLKSEKQETEMEHWKAFGMLLAADSWQRGETARREDDS